MQVDEALAYAIDRSGKSARAISKELGRSPAWAALALRSQAPQLDTLARVADLAGLDVALVDRESGDVVAVVDVPTD